MHLDMTDESQTSFFCTNIKRIGFLIKVWSINSYVSTKAPS